MMSSFSGGSGVLQFLLRISCLNWCTQSTQLSEALAQLGHKQLGLLKRGEVTALRNLVPIEKPRWAWPRGARAERAQTRGGHGDGGTKGAVVRRAGGGTRLWRPRGGV